MLFMNCLTLEILSIQGFPPGRGTCFAITLWDGLL